MVSFLNHKWISAPKLCYHFDSYDSCGLNDQALEFVTVLVGMTVIRLQPEFLKPQFSV